MITYQIAPDTVDVSVVLRVIDETTGVPEAALEHDTTGIALQYRREGAANVAITEAALAALTTAHADGGVEYIGNGYFRLDLPDAACAAGAAGVLVHGTVTGMVIIGCYIQLEGHVNKVYSDTTAVHSDTTAVHTQTTAIVSDTTAIHSDTTAIHLQTATIYSDTTAIHAQTTAIVSDTTAIHSDTTAIHTQTTAIVSDTTAIHSDTTAIHTQTTAIHSDTTAIHLQTTSVLSDTTAIHLQTTSILSDTTHIHSDTTAIHTQTTAIVSDTTAIHSDTTAIHTQTTAIVSDTTAIHLDTTAVHSDTTAIHTQTTAMAAVVADLPFKKNTAIADFAFEMLDAATALVATTGLTVTGEVSKDGGAYAGLTNAVTELANGTYLVDLAAGDVNCDFGTLKFTAATAKTTFIHFITHP